MSVNSSLYQGPANVSFALFTPPSSVFSLCPTRLSLPNMYTQLSSALRYIYILNAYSRLSPNSIMRSESSSTRYLNPTINTMRPRLGSGLNVLHVDPHSSVCKSEIDMSNRTFRIRLFAHSSVVPGPVVVYRTSQRTGN